jgi:hypothetical protein
MTSQRKTRSQKKKGSPQPQREGVREETLAISGSVSSPEDRLKNLTRGWVCCNCSHVHISSNDGRVCNFLHIDGNSPHQHCCRCKEVYILNENQLDLIPRIDHRIGERGWFHHGCSIHHHDDVASSFCTCSKTAIPSNTCSTIVTIEPPQPIPEPDSRPKQKSSAQSSRCCTTL